MSKTVTATDDNFENEVLQSDQTVLVDFWAPWCGPCQQLGPVLEELSEEMGNVKIVKLNIDENPETPTTYGVRGIPTMMIFKNGQLVETKVGVLPKLQVSDWIQSNV